MQKLDKGADAIAYYAQLVTYFRDNILSGALAAGARLPTEFELAQQHQISRGTVRQALNILVNEGLLERVPGRGTFVREIAPPEQEARTSSKRIGLILSQPVLQLSMEVLLGVVQTAKARGYEVSVTYAEESREQQARDIAWLKANEVAGIILLPLNNTAVDATFEELQKARVPLVMVDRYLPGFDTDYVVSNNLEGGYRATEHLIILGHRKIGFAYSNADGLQTTSVRDRWLGYRKALEAYNLAYDETLVFGDLPLPGQPDQHAVDEIVLSANRPGAIFAVNDTLALGLLQAAKRHEIKVPEDLALVGFDDLNYAAYVTPPLTTVAQPRLEIGVRAANLLINRFEGQTGPIQHIELPTNLIVRVSCGVRLHIKQSMLRS